MDFSYTPRMAELRRTAQDLVGVIVKYENECERNNGLGPDAHRAIREAVLASGLQAINVPVQWGGAGLTVLEQVVVSETLGSLTNALWDTVWRPANPLLACSPQQRQKYLIPAARGERRDAVAITEETAGSDPSAVRTSATPDGDGYRISGNKWFVTVGGVADFLIVLPLPDRRTRRRCSWWTPTLPVFRSSARRGTGTRSSTSTRSSLSTTSQSARPGRGRQAGRLRGLQPDG